MTDYNQFNVDLDGDGVADVTGYGVDTDGDGIVDSISIDIDGDGEVTSVTRNSSTKLTIKVTLPAVEYSDDYYDDDDDLEIWDLEWDDDGTAYWEENDYAKRYEVKLYRDGALVKDATKVSDEDYDFSD